MQKFLESQYNGIDGVVLIDSGRPGKSIGILGITHGNEPVGLSIFRYLIEEYDLKTNLKSGKVFLIAVNIEAYKNYCRDGDQFQWRYIDHNMNRIGRDPYDKASQEHRRLGQLKDLLLELDVVLDLHSVPIGNDIIGICDKSYIQEAKQFFDVETILLDDMGATGALIGILIREGKVAYGLECGNHIDPDGLEIGIKNVLNLFVHYGSIMRESVKVHKTPMIFQFMQEIIPKTDEFKYKKSYSGFTYLKPGEKYATDGVYCISNTFGEEIYLGIVMKDSKKGEGAGFLFKRLD